MDGPKKIILTSHRQWDAWLAMVKQMATIHQLWQYIDPDVENPPPFESPLPPRPQDVNASASRITDLNSEERDLYKLLIQQHALEVDAWSGKDKAMKALHELVCSTIPIGTLTRLLSLSDDDGSNNARAVHTLLQTLKAEYAPTILDHRQRIADEYNRLKQPPRGRNLIAWIDQWKLIKPKLEAAGLSESLTFIPDFLNANMSVDPNFTSSRSTDALRGKIPWDELLDDFRLHYRFLGGLSQNPPLKPNSAVKL
ncbi:hypothetical protein VTN31DRAFT_5949 [Thermomyces dupontii]|uniref:uncharacterized protein n=1 Tax=Talaromyces thermophilus TaxID=28565 RepID=UPI003743927E